MNAKDNLIGMMGLNTQRMETLRAETDKYLDGLKEARGAAFADLVRMGLITRSYIQALGSIVNKMAVDSENTLKGAMRLTIVRELSTETCTQLLSLYAVNTGIDEEGLKDAGDLADTYATELDARVQQAVAP